MLEGLEISEITFSKAKEDNPNFRVDSEYFRKYYLDFFKSMSNLSPLGSFVLEGYRVIYENTDVLSSDVGRKSNFPIFIQATDLDTPFIKTDNLYYVHECDWVRYPKGRVNVGELLIEVKGKVEKVSIVPENFPKKALVTGSLYKMSVNNKINKYYLLAYLICKYGVSFKERYKTNLLISFVSKDDLYRIPVPIFSLSFQREVERIFSDLFQLKQDSQQVYAQAENILLKNLDMADFIPSSEPVNIKSFKESFGTSGRLDAEYYQSKYDTLEITLSKKNKIAYLGDLLSINQRGKQPDYANIGLPVVNSKHVRASGVVFDNNRLAAFDDKTLLIQYGDVLINGTGVGTIGRAVVYLQENKAIPDNHVTILRTNKINPLYLSVYLNSVAGQMQVDKYFKGSSGQIELYPSDIANFLIPLASEQKQQKIADLVQQSFALKAQSEHLLDVAKRAVEIAIEQDEDAALAYITHEVKDGSD